MRDRRGSCCATPRPPPPNSSGASTMTQAGVTDLTTPDPVVAEANELRRALGPVNLILIGIGAIIGAGIFVYTGTAAAQHAGPAVILSFVIAGFGCLFAGLCYAEFASMIPESGSAYT